MSWATHRSPTLSELSYFSSECSLSPSGGLSPASSMSPGVSEKDFGVGLFPELGSVDSAVLFEGEITNEQVVASHDTVANDQPNIHSYARSASTDSEPDVKTVLSISDRRIIVKSKKSDRKVKPNALHSIKVKAEKSVVPVTQSHSLQIGDSMYVPFKGKEPEMRDAKNAINAKINREKKKAYISGLEEEVTGLRRDTHRLHGQVANLAGERQLLLEEVEYLRKVLANDSSISSVLESLGGLKGVSLSSSLGEAKKRRMDSEGNVLAKKKRVSNGLSSGGVCLHVDQGHVAIEFCSQCAANAGSS